MGIRFTIWNTKCAGTGDSPNPFTLTAYRHGIHDDGTNRVVFCGASQYRHNVRTKRCLARIMVDYTLTK